MKNLLNVILFVGAMVSALAVVTVQNDSKQRFIEWDKSQKAAQQFEADYARLQLAQSRFMNHKAVETAAAAQGLGVPDSTQTKIIMVTKDAH